MADTDIAVLILTEHDGFRRAFASIEDLGDLEEVRRRWDELADALEVHASGEEEIFYPELLQDVPDAEDDTEHAVKDHNEIRDAVRSVAVHELGSDAWWDAFRVAREATTEHLEEEEQDVLPPFRDTIDSDTRSRLGMRWLQFHEQHDRARGLSGDDKDPEQYVEQHS